MNIENFIINKYINNYPTELKDKVLYLLQNGKRLRPILFLIFSNSSIDNNDTTINNTIYNIAIYIEIIHSLSLVLDDLPEMDNDSLRRDNLTFHIKYGIDYTNFFVYYMFNHIVLDLDTSINIFLDNKYENLELTNNIINDIKEIINKNINLLIDGQYNDLEWNKKKIENTSNTSNTSNTNTIEFLKEKDVILELLDIDNNIIEIICSIEKINEIELNINLNMKKTSSLFNLSITLGYILQLWKKNINYVNNKKYIIIYELLSVFSNILGYMFQISDDLLDIDNDIKNNKPNICAIIDKDIVRKLLKNGCKWLYENAEMIHDLMQQDLEKQLLEKAAPKEVLKKNFTKMQDLENPARKEVFKKMQDLENPAHKEVFKKMQDLENPARKEFFKKMQDEERMTYDDIEYDIENNIEYDIKYDIEIEYETKINTSNNNNNNTIINQKITFDIKSINEIIEKIENRIK